LYATCRSFGHAWVPSANSAVRSSFGVVLTLRCDRCSTERVDALGYGGRLISRRYLHPEDYATKPGESLSRDEWRAEWIKEVVGSTKPKRVRKERTA